MNDTDKLLEIWKWVEIAKQLRATCQNPDVLDALIAVQAARYRSLFRAIEDAARRGRIA